MVAEIYIISGFLGAGKTTLIQKLLKESFKDNKVAVIENDFGEISVDAALLKEGGVEVREINSGCICCSLSGDFVKALKELLERFQPDKILIEPSGVSKLSDIAKSCSDPFLRPYAKVKSKITVVDVKRCKIYLDNFGEFFEDQIQNADVILLNRAEDFPDKVSDAYKLVNSLNERSAIISKSWDQMTADEILNSGGERHIDSDQGSYHIHECGCGPHDHDMKPHTHHSAEDIFDTVTIRTKHVFNIEDLKARVSHMEQIAQGNVIRAKGILRGTKGYINLEYSSGDIRITNCATEGDMLCIIGRNLNRQKLCSLFNGK